MLKRHSLSLAIMFSSLSLVACNSNDDDNASLPSKAVTTTTITVTPSLGKILNGRVALKNAKTGAVLAPTQTLTPSSNGVAKFTVPVAKLADPILAEVLPTTEGKVEYFDEALEKNKTITVPTADIAKPILRAAASVTANANIGVTALTEAAVQQAAKQASGLIAQNINNANVAVKNALNLKFDITQAPIVVGYGEFDKLVNAALDTQRRAYATYLATLAKEAQRIDSASATPAYHMARAFADDFSHDGVFNAVGSKALEINYNNAFLTDWFKWVENFYTSFAGLGNLVAFNRWYYGFNITDKNSVTTYPDAVPIRTVDGVEEYACSGEGRIKSSQGASIYMDFVNQRGSNMNIYWLNTNGSRVTYKTNLLNNQTHNQQTFVTHPWLVTDNTGTCVAIYRPVTATKKTITFKADGVMIGSEIIAQPTACTTGVETTFATSVGNAPYTNGQKVCFSATTSSLGFDNKTLTSPVKNTVVQDPYSAYSFKDGSYSYEVVFNNNALYEINLSSTSFLGQFTPLVSMPVVETCVSKNLAVAPLSSIADYNGDYKENGTVVFNLNTATAKATVKGTDSNISEVCGPTNLSNGTNHVLITDKGNVTLFKTTAGVYSAEGQEFADKTKVFYGEKASVVTNDCTSQGADDKLGFTNAPSDFCGFTKATSTAISNPDIYTFFNSDKKENVKVTLANNAVTSVSIENDKYSFACGVGFTACSGVTLNTANTNTIEFVFNNTALSVANGASQGITVKNGSLIHQKSTGGSGSSSLAFNSAKCTQASSQTAFGMTAIAYNLCASDAVGDFSLTAQDNNTFSPTHDGIPCTITKVGSAVTLTKGAKSLTVQFNGDSTDVMTLRTGALTDAQVENDITARTAVGDPAGQTVRIEIRKNGTVASAQAQNIQGNESFGCVAL